MGKYRVALVGCGGMGKSHLNTLEKMQEFEVVGLCDVVVESIDKAREICGDVASFNDFVKMYD